MFQTIQKLKLYGLVLLFIVGVAIPLVFTRSVLAAKTFPNGTCFITKISASGEKHLPPEQCSKTGYRDNNGVPVTGKSGKPLDPSKCYDIVINSTSIGQGGGSSGSSILAVNCDDTPLPPPTQTCASDSNPNNTVSCVTCPGSGLQVGSLADCSDSAATSGNCAQISNCDLVNQYLDPLVNFLAALAGVAIVISIIIGGIQYSGSAGDPQKASAAKNRIRNAIIALIVFVMLYAMLNFLIPGGLV